MLNYITLNGIKSNTIKGLLIQSLPPITKPLLRTETEEIDGRDGDVITKLGYSAYDKEVVIGLYGDYEVNDVLNYFNSEGVVTFSNEPDKYYKYAIYEQIDLEKLLRFKTATITFHVQPFKYSAVDKAYIYNQSNVLKIPNMEYTKDGVTVSATDGVITVTGTHTNPVNIYIPIKPIQATAGAWIFSATANGLNISCNVRLVSNYASQSGTFGGRSISLINNTEVSIDADLTEDITYNYLWLNVTDDTTEDFTFTAKFQSNANSGRIEIINRGNIDAKPLLKIKGEGLINLSLSSNLILTINLTEYHEIIIDIDQLNAYNDSRLLNRYVAGNYDDFKLKAGLNVITWSGIVREFEIDNFSRWI